MCLDNLKPFRGREPKYVYKVLELYGTTFMGKDKYRTPIAEQQIKIGKWNRGKILKSIFISRSIKNITHIGKICVYKNLKDARVDNDYYNSIFKCEVKGIKYTGLYSQCKCYLVKRIKPIKEVS